jgi:hypothetical protein
MALSVPNNNVPTPEAGSGRTRSPLLGGPRSLEKWAQISVTGGGGPRSPRWIQLGHPLPYPTVSQDTTSSAPDSQAGPSLPAARAAHLFRFPFSVRGRSHVHGRES